MRPTPEDQQACATWTTPAEEAAFHLKQYYEMRDRAERAEQLAGDLECRLHDLKHAAALVPASVTPIGPAFTMTPGDLSRVFGSAEAGDAQPVTPTPEEALAEIERRFLNVRGGQDWQEQPDDAPRHATLRLFGIVRAAISPASVTSEERGASQSRIAHGRPVVPRLLPEAELDWIRERHAVRSEVRTTIDRAELLGHIAALDAAQPKAASPTPGGDYPDYPCETCGAADRDHHDADCPYNPVYDEQAAQPKAASPTPLGAGDDRLKAANELLRLAEQFADKTDLAMQLQIAANLLRRADALLSHASGSIDAMVCTEGDDAGVFMLSPESAFEVDEKGRQCYLNECFTPLGDALVGLYRVLTTPDVPLPKAASPTPGEWEFALERIVDCLKDYAEDHHMERHLATLRAALASRWCEWQPIAEAKTDGTRYLLCDARQGWIEAGEYLWSCEAWYVDSDEQMEPTHFMEFPPLPAPPPAETNERSGT